LRWGLEQETVHMRLPPLGKSRCDLPETDLRFQDLDYNKV
jgi:hypothetical protein